MEQEFSQIAQNCLTLIQKYLEIYFFTNNIDTNQGIQINNPTDSLYKDALFYLNFFTKNWNNLLVNKFSNSYILSIIHSLRYMRNKVSHQAPVSLREIYKFVDDTQTMLEILKVGGNEINGITNLRKKLMGYMINSDDSQIVLGKATFNNFCDMEDCKMEDAYPDEDNKNSNGINNFINNTQNVNLNYQRIIQNEDHQNFYKCSEISGDKDN
ncbi:MAG: Swt1 family HEPN domain-containing protein [archaeon]|nr:Swt1 family HEPN domain-containing protein [archaeon]